jgi:hypothetical protein
MTNQAQAACNATVNGRPMTEQECAITIQVYGQVIPGDYLVDDYGNWVNVNNPNLRGNTYTDARYNQNNYYDGQSYDSQPAQGGYFGGGSYVSPRGIYDPSGGCEGGSCVNIID